MNDDIGTGVLIFLICIGLATCEFENHYSAYFDAKTSQIERELNETLHLQE